MRPYQSLLFRKWLCVPLLGFVSGLHAEEGGSGHYLPGSMSSFMDGVPPRETFLARLNVLYYEGSNGKNFALPFAGLPVAGVDAESLATGLTLLWRPPVDLGEKWSYAASVTVPWVWMDVTADVQAELLDRVPVSVHRSDRVDGLGDMVLLPLMLNYKFTDDFNINFRAAAYAPTGDYEVGRLANPGKNYWSFEPTLAFMYFGRTNGFEASLFSGVTFNTENDKTDYKSGNQFHMDGTLAQHLPLAGGLVGIGVNGYWYEQITGDSGAGATFGEFEGSTAGLGPVLSWTKKFGGMDLIAEVKWLHEMETGNRLEGDFLWAKVIFKF